ncbi:flippase [Oceanirhabdus seepicola]|uniref:Flippase n=1 Tax=Oceanirhabdus seepicola TaxID=2828781 RepID=A0A9J6P8H9_9CLOT|nr:flippase [Oceanirhabdus seepicola]MCM1992508.1 flippase [Oceanirhabdus seepicola]
MNTNSSLKKNLMYMFVCTIGVQIVNLIIIIYISRVLSVDVVGLVNLSQAIILYFTLLTLFGFQTLGSKEVVKSVEKDEIVYSVISIRMIIALLSIVVIAIIAMLMTKGESFSTILLLYSLTLIPLCFNLDWFFTGIYEMKHNGVFNVIKVIIPLCIIVAFLKSDSDVYVIPIAFLIGLIMAGCYHIYKFKSKGFSFSKRDRMKRKLLLTMALPFVMTSILSTINGNVDTIMVGELLNEHELGIYSNSYKLIFFLISMIAVLFNVTYPKLTKLKGQELRSFFGLLTRVVIMFAIPISIGGFIFSKEILVLLFGKKYIEGSMTLKILMIYFMVLFIRELCAYSLNAWGKERIYLKIIGISAIANIIINYIAITNIGIEGAALSTLFCEIMTFVLMALSVRENVNLSYLKETIKILPAICLLTAILIVFKIAEINIILVIPISILVYFGVLYKSGYLNTLRTFLK